MAKNSSTHTAQLSDILVETDRCVLCGLCLPHCPTYDITRNENNSPRGRIALIRAMAQKQLTPEKTLANHINSCLACFACESRCPAQVSYRKILYFGWRQLAIQQQSSRWQRFRAKLPMLPMLLLRRAKIIWRYLTPSSQSGYQTGSS
jgi:glycolate oxidase iron-sulfur subunit